MNLYRWSRIKQTSWQAQKKSSEYSEDFFSIKNILVKFTAVILNICFFFQSIEDFIFTA